MGTGRRGQGARAGPPAEWRGSQEPAGWPSGSWAEVAGGRRRGCVWDQEAGRPQPEGQQVVGMVDSAGAAAWGGRGEGQGPAGRARSPPRGVRAPTTPWPPGRGRASARPVCSQQGSAWARQAQPHAPGGDSGSAGWGVTLARAPRRLRAAGPSLWMRSCLSAAQTPGQRGGQDQVLSGSRPGPAPASRAHPHSDLRLPSVAVTTAAPFPPLPLPIPRTPRRARLWESPPGTSQAASMGGAEHSA